MNLLLPNSPYQINQQVHFLKLSTVLPLVIEIKMNYIQSHIVQKEIRKTQDQLKWHTFS